MEASNAFSSSELRTGALAAIDRGDLREAERRLDETLRFSPQSVATRRLLAAVRAITNGDGASARPFANVPVARVSAPPEAPPSRPGALVTKKRVLPTPVGPSWKRLGDMRYPHAIVKFDIDDPKVWVPPFLPRRLANNGLILARPSDGRWIATYGRGHLDARFVAVLGPDGHAEHVLDFAAWRARNQIAEAGVAWAELEGDTLYIKTEIMAYEGFLAAVDLPTGRTCWRSERVAFATNFALADDRLAVWMSTPTSTIISVDKSTGKTLSRASMGPLALPNALLVEDGFVEAHGVSRMKDNEVLRLDVPATRARQTSVSADIRPPARTELSESHVDPRDDAARIEAWTKIDAGDPVGALLTLRDVLERSPTNFATEALFDAARNEAAEARRRGESAVRALTPIVVASDNPLGRAPIARGRKPPKLRIVEERETRRHRSGWFAESGLAPTTFDRDVSPSALSILPEPTWLPASLQGARRWVDVTAPDHTVGVYEPEQVVVFREGRPVTVLDASKADFQMVLYADVQDDIAFLAEAKGPSIVAVDTKTGAQLWRTKDIRAESLVLTDGYVIATHSPYNQPSQIVVLEGDTGKVVSRVTLKAQTSRYRLVLANGFLYGFDSVMACKLAVE